MRIKCFTNALRNSIVNTFGCHGSYGVRDCYSRKIAGREIISLFVFGVYKRKTCLLGKRMGQDYQNVIVIL